MNRTEAKHQTQHKTSATSLTGR